MAEEEPILQIKIEADWTDFDAEMARRERQMGMGGMTFGAESVSPFRANPARTNFMINRTGMDPAALPDDQLFGLLSNTKTPLDLRRAGQQELFMRGSMPMGPQPLDWIRPFGIEQTIDWAREIRASPQHRRNPYNRFGQHDVAIGWEGTQDPFGMAIATPESLLDMYRNSGHPGLRLNTDTAAMRKAVDVQMNRMGSGQQIHAPFVRLNPENGQSQLISGLPQIMAAAQLGYERMPFHFQSFSPDSYTWNPYHDLATRPFFEGKGSIGEYVGSAASMRQTSRVMVPGADLSQSTALALRDPRAQLETYGREMFGQFEHDRLAQQLLRSPDALGLLQGVPYGSRLLGTGMSAAAFRIPSGDVARLGLTTDRLQSPDILQAMSRETSGDWMLERLPYAPGAGATMADVRGLSSRLAAQGLNFGDAAPDNIGRHEGRWVVTDPGAVTRGGGGGTALMRLESAAAAASASLERMAAGAATASQRMLPGPAGGGGGRMLPPPPPGAAAAGAMPDPDDIVPYRQPMQTGMVRRVDPNRLPPEFIDIPSMPGQGVIPGAVGPGGFAGAGAALPPPAAGGGGAGMVPPWWAGGPGTTPGGRGRRTFVPVGWRRNFGGGGGAMGRPAGPWSMNTGIYYAAMFGLWEVATAWDATQRAETQASLAMTNIEEAQARITGVEAATGGILGSTVGLGFNLFDAANGTSFGPAAVRTNLMQQIFREERQNEFAAGVRNRRARTADMAASLMGDIEGDALRQATARRNEREILVQQQGQLEEAANRSMRPAEMPGWVRTAANTLTLGLGGGLAEQFWGMMAPNRVTPETLALRSNIAGLQQDIGQLDTQAKLDEVILSRRRRARDSDIRVMDLGSARTNRLTAGREDAFRTEAWFREQQMYEEQEQASIRNAPESEMAAIRRRGFADIGAINTAGMRERNALNLGMRGNVLASLQSAGGNEIEADFTRLKTSIQQAIAGANTMSEAFRAGAEGAASIVQFRANVARQTFQTGQDIQSSTAATNFAIGRDPLNMSIENIRQGGRVALRNPFVMMSPQLQQDVLANTQAQEALARQQFNDQAIAANQAMGTRSDVIRALRGRNPALAGLESLEGAFQTDMRNFRNAGMGAQAVVRSQLQLDEIGLARQNFQDSFSGTQMDLANVRISNRDFMDPGIVFGKLKEMEADANQQLQSSQQMVAAQGRAAATQPTTANALGMGQNPVVQAVQQLMSQLPQIIADGLEKGVPD